MLDYTRIIKRQSLNYVIRIRQQKNFLKKLWIMKVQRLLKEVIGKKELVPIDIIKAEKQEIKNNKIVER